MTKTDALELENKCDELMSKAIGEKCNVSMALTGRLKINIDDNYISLSKDFTYASYVNFHGDFSDLMNYISKACICISDNKEVFDKLIWSYDHILEIK